MVLLIDNYDSFSFNLYQLVGSIDPDIKVIRSDELTVEEIRALKPDYVILSPGPGRPADAGVYEDLLRECKGEFPILGVCLGHQAIGEVFGGTVSYAKQVMHGKQSVAKQVHPSKILKGVPEQFGVARYHSLAIIDETMPSELIVTSHYRRWRSNERRTQRLPNLRRAIPSGIHHDTERGTNDSQFLQK